MACLSSYELGRESNKLHCPGRPFGFVQSRAFKPGLCNRNSITSLTHFKSAALLCLPSRHSGAMLSKPNCLIYCDLKPHHEPYCIIRVKSSIDFHLKKLMFGNIVYLLISYSHSFSNSSNDLPFVSGTYRQVSKKVKTMNPIKMK